MAAWLILLLIMQASLDQPPPIGIIDFYGLGSIPVAQVREALQIKEGDTLTEAPKDARRRLEAQPDVVQARIELVCCEAGKSILYVGLQRKGDAALEFRRAPRGNFQLPPEVLQAGQDFEKAFSNAIFKGDAGEDRSHGHALNNNPQVHAIQERFVPLANRHLSRLREVLRGSADSGQRALAAQVIAYVSDKESVVPDLVFAMRDSDGSVRNNAMRALLVMADLSYARGKKLRIPATSFVDMLNSIEWTDRNKASGALFELTTDRNPAILSRLRSRALPALIEMARWKAPGHAQPALFLLGRMAGLPEDRIQALWDAGDREAVIKAARK